MSRLFDGVDDQMVYTVPASGLDVNSGHTLLIVIREIATNDAIWQSYLETETSGAAAAATLGRRNNGLLYWAQGVSDTSAVAMTDSDNWVVASAKKTAGSSIPNFYKGVIGGGDTHTAGGGSLVASPSIASGTIRIAGNDDFGNIRVAAVAIFNRVLSDAEENSINAAKTTQSIYDLTPVWLVDDADAFAVDYMGNANRTSITGTADDADDPSGWVYGIGGSGATVTVPAPADAVGSFPAPAVTSPDATVVSPPADATGTFPPANGITSSDVGSGPMSAPGSFPAPAVSGNTVSDGTVVSPQLDGTGDLTSPTIAAGSNVVTPPMAATGDLIRPTVSPMTAGTAGLDFMLMGVG